MWPIASLLACLQARPAADPGCVACHGSQTSAAPPKALGGFEDVTVRGVGAHQAHLAPDTARALACTECHDVPASVDAPGHNDTPVPAEVRWADGIGGTGAEPYDAVGGTCTVYCHGPDPAVWTDPRTGVCGTCHDNPPDTPSHQCAEPGTCPQCHTPSADGWASGDPARHVDGLLDFDDGGFEGCGTGDTEPACDACHGANGDAAPPPDLQGDTETTAPGVGAHQTHLDGTATSAAVPCAACHPVPAAIGDPLHADGATDVTMAAGTYARPTCADTTCHGPAQPDWTVVGGGEAACGTCHGLPPPAPHPQNPTCGPGCHPNAGKGTIDDPSRHVDGTVDL